MLVEQLPEQRHVFQLVVQEPEEVEQRRVVAADVQGQNRAAVLLREAHPAGQPLPLYQAANRRAGQPAGREDNDEPLVLERAEHGFNGLLALGVIPPVLHPLDRDDHLLELRRHSDRIAVGEEDHVLAHGFHRVVDRNAVGDPGGVVRHQNGGP